MAKHIDFVLLSHADQAHLGGYAYAHAKLGLTCPAIASIPVHDLGRLAARETVHDCRATRDFALYNTEDINAAFENITALRYSQPHNLGGKGKGITVTAFQAGHSLGGTIWKIKTSTDEIIYAVDYNHQMERHLGRTVLNAKELERPSLLITDAYNAQYNFLPSQEKRPLRDSAFFDNISATLFSGGNVLIPVTSTTRALELTFLLEDFWTKSVECSQKFPIIYFLSPQSSRIIHAAKRTLEWMGTGIAKLLTMQDRKVPFDFTYVKYIQNLSEIEQSSVPKVIFASSASLEPGSYSRRLFFEWCKGELNLVLLPDRGDPETLLRRVYDEWMAVPKLNEAVAVNLNFEVSFAQESHRVPLEGNELADYLRAETAKKDAAAAAAELARLAAMEENGSDDDDDDGVENNTMRKVNDGADGIGAFGNAYDIYVKDAYRGGGFFKQNQSYRMFPVSNARGWVDDYGEAVDPMMFVNEDTAAMEEATEELPQVQIEEMQDFQDTIPSKYIVASIDLQVQCKVIFIDFEGRSDGKSVKNILTQVAPRKLILVHGSEESTSDLERYCLENSALTNDVFAPHNNEWVNVSSASDVHDINGYELAYVSGYIKVHKGTQNEPDEMEVDSGNEQVESAASTLVPTLDILPLELSKSHKPVLVGDVKLSEFRKILVSKGFETEFVAGVLVVNRSIMIRKSREQYGKLVLEGSLSADYYACRKLLYAEHAVL
ncbi:cleavage and polyadenylation specificity factor subunit 2 [Physocladia obscura]|uniref:Cleavage and polyadenylation specificity factor subunit 2 n=1 Tax=Physocladia obscura TaxID=109957 RepID=A0AAD5T0L0_9FUNG|nr:cleavage and polyadenylation specificity factor subunit 2 [Physocladia obscura]